MWLYELCSTCGSEKKNHNVLCPFSMESVVRKLNRMEDKLDEHSKVSKLKELVSELRNSLASSRAQTLHFSKYATHREDCLYTLNKKGVGNLELFVCDCGFNNFMEEKDSE